MFQVVERFVSIQGESTHAGRPCYFIRLAGCNLRCHYCDTVYAQQHGTGQIIPHDQLVDDVVASGIKLVEITGGEPLLHHDLPLLCQLLLDRGIEVLVETNGSCPIADLPKACKKILDCKLPDSGMAEYNLYENYALLQEHDEVKFVVSSRADFDFAVDTIQKYHLERKTPNLLLSPVWGKVDFAELADWLLASKAPARMQIQLHKIIWGKDAIGK